MNRSSSGDRPRPPDHRPTSRPGATPFVDVGRALLWFAAAAVVTSHGESLADKVKISGTVATGYLVDHKPRPEAEAEVRFASKRVLATRAVLKLEARYFSDDVDLEDAYIDHRLSGRFRIQLGVNKKRLGLEYQQKRSKRLTPKRSLLYRRLEEMAIVGRQLNARLIAKIDRELRLELTTGTDGNRDLNALAHLARRRGAAGAGVWALIEQRRVDHGYMTIWAGALSVWHIGEHHRWVLELMMGIDPIESDLLRLLGTGRKVRFVGAKTETAARLAMGGGYALEPLVQTSLLIRDTADLEASAVQLLGGVNLRRGPAVLALTASYFAETERAADDPTITGPYLHVQARLHF